MGNITNLEARPARMLRAMSASSCITFGTDAPYQFGAVGFASIGFADIPAVGFTGHCRRDDVSALVPMARQHILRAVKAADLPVDAVDLRVVVGARSRERMFTDANPTSPSHGKRKRGAEVAFTLEVRREFRRAFESKLPKVWL